MVPRDPEYSTASVLIELRPALSEITIADEDDLYFAGLKGFYDSLKRLERDLRSEGVGISWWMNSYAENGQHIHRHAPPEIARFILPLNAPRAAATIQKVLKLWAGHVKGRRIRVRCDGIEVEASQLSGESFSEMLKKVVEYRERAKLCKGELRPGDARAGFHIVDSGRSDDERTEINRRVSQMDTEVRNRYREKRGLTRPGAADPGPQRSRA